MIRVRSGCRAIAITALAAAVIASSGIAAAQTGSIANGKATYAAWCVGCHNANPLVDAHGVINGANNPNFILNVWSTDPNMTFLLTGALPDPVQSAADVAAYLGSLTGGTPFGQLQVPPSVNLGSQTVGAQSGSQAIKLSNVGGASVTVSSIASSNAGEFIIASQNCTGASVPVGGNCKANVAFKPAALGARSATLTVTSSGTGSPQTIVLTGTGVAAPPPPAQNNYQGLWWASPAGSESGWGINIAHQGDTIFASWFTYDLAGKGWWLVMTASKGATETYSGVLYTTTGPAFNAVLFNPLQVVATQVGTGTLSFGDANNASFAYVVNGIPQTKTITREVFGPLPSCVTASSSASLTAATNYQDLWWAAPASSESGWGINLTHQGDTIFASWFTYDLDRTPMWLVVTAGRSAPGLYTGTLYRTAGPAFNVLPFNPNAVVPTAVGTATFTFNNGNSATFAYTVNGISQAKSITREIFTPPGTLCQ